jgi:hypothetical protein
MIVTKENFQQVREQGLGNGFAVINPADGFRKDNRLWFGECSECGERITNSALDGVWKHTIYTIKGYYSKEAFDNDGMANHTQSYQVDYCPKVDGVVVECERYYQIDGEKFYA